MEASKLQAVFIRNKKDIMGGRLGHLWPAQQKAVNDICRCRTPECGILDILECSECGTAFPIFASCRNRSCPICQGSASVKWTKKINASLFDVPYNHLVFTLPHEFIPLITNNPTNQRIIYDILFKASSETVIDLFQSAKFYHATPGIISVLHTWNQKLLLHPHVHMLVSCGGLNLSKDAWISGKSSFLFPVDLMSKVFKAKFMQKLGEAINANVISIPQNILSSLVLNLKQWCVYCKPPISKDGSPILIQDQVGQKENLVSYLARYTFKIAITDSRIISIENGQVSFKRRNNEKTAKAGSNVYDIETLSDLEFIQRYMLHVLPSGFMKIRHYGLHSPRLTSLYHDKITELIPSRIVPKSSDTTADATSVSETFADASPDAATGNASSDCATSSSHVSANPASVVAPQSEEPNIARGADANLIVSVPQVPVISLPVNSEPPVQVAYPARRPVFMQTCPCCKRGVLRKPTSERARLITWYVYEEHRAYCSKQGYHARC